MLTDLDKVVRQSLTEFTEAVFNTQWLGREREAVSQFVFGHLIHHCKPGSFLWDPTQIGIEVAVPQLKGPNRKRQVTKDLVIWRAPGMTCWNTDWDPVQVPLAILEWKVFYNTQRGSAKISTYDVDWLCKFSADLETFVGYAVTLDLLARRFRLTCTRVYKGHSTDKWLHVRV
jgi:hypothetical protein